LKWQFEIECPFCIHQFVPSPFCKGVWFPDWSKGLLRTYRLVLLANCAKLPRQFCHLAIQKSKNRVAIAAIFAGATFFDRAGLGLSLRFLELSSGKILFLLVFYNLLCPTAKGAVLRMNLSSNTTPKQGTGTQKQSVASQICEVE
jgi:hypothetical protein